MCGKDAKWTQNTADNLRLYSLYTVWCNSKSCVGPWRHTHFLTRIPAAARPTPGP